jgi:pimeloyl-ACP methyl ester carboxylesterase
MEWPEIVSAIRCPTLLITSEPERGGIVTEEVAKKAAILNPNLRVAKIGGAGHNIRRENYGNYMWVVKSFLKQV